ncbi:MAG: iron-containing alcohol dehydrogenase [Lentisphaeria bacterium]|nr:iron-containing alcohol dehydrogenase [Lentisphaeria bacterium]
MWTKAVDIYSVREIKTRTEICFGVGAIGRLDGLLKNLKEHGVNTLLLLTGKNSFRRSGADKEVIRTLKENAMQWSHFECSGHGGEISLIGEAVKEGRKTGAQAVLAAGGGNVTDVGKCVALLLAQEGERHMRELLEGTFVPEKTLPLLVINLSHGSGSENNAFALLSDPEKKETHVIQSHLLYPWKVICDPALAVSMPRLATRYAAMDAVNHALESATSKNANPLSILLSHEIIKLVSRYLARVEKDPGDLEGRYFLQFASLLGGLATDNGGGHFSHALLHPLHTLRPELPHGLGVSVLMPSVVKKVYPEYGKVLAAVFAPVVPDLAGNAEEAEDAAAGLEVWISGCGVKLDPLDALFLKENIDELVETSYQNPSLSLLLTTAPLETSRDAIRSIFDDALTPSGKDRTRGGAEDAGEMEK